MATIGEPAMPHRGVRTSLPQAARVFVLAVLAGAALEAALVLPAAAARLSANPRDLWVPAAYATGLVVAERFVVRVPLRNHRFSIGVAEIVIVLGVVFLDLPLLVLATGIGIAASQWLFEAQLVKRLFNVPQYMLSVGAAALVSDGLIQSLSRADPSFSGPPGSFDPTLTVPWVLGMTTFFLVNHTLVSIVISMSVGQGLAQTWLRAAPVAAADWAASTAYGLVIAALVVDDRVLLLPLLVVPIGLTLLGNRAWARSLAQGQRMHSLYQAGRALSNRLGDLGAWQAFVQQVAEVLNCEGAAVFLGRPSDGALEVIASDGANDRITVIPSPVAWEQAAKGYATRSGWSRLHLVAMEA
jgi:hypothetical protein